MAALRSLPKSQHIPNSGYTGPSSGVPGLSTAHIPPQRPDTSVIWYEGGDVSTVVIPPAEAREQVGGGKRGRIREFTRASRRRVLRYFASFNKSKIKILPLFIHLTYPDQFPTDPEVWKRDLEKFAKRLRRKYGRFGALWRMEFQVRKSGLNEGVIAPHIHIIAFLDLEPSDLYEFVSRSWYEACGKLDPKHERAGTKVERVHSWRQATSYAAKYLGKLEQFSEAFEFPGRFYGKWCRDLLDQLRDHHEDEVRYEDVVRVRRIYRKMSGVRPREHLDCEPRSLTVFINYSTTLRLLRYLGYYATAPPDQGPDPPARIPLLQGSTGGDAPRCVLPVGLPPDRLPGRG